VFPLEQITDQQGLGYSTGRSGFMWCQLACSVELNFRLMPIRAQFAQYGVWKGVRRCRWDRNIEVRGWKRKQQCESHERLKKNPRIPQIPQGERDKLRKHSPASHSSFTDVMMRLSHGPTRLRFRSLTHTCTLGSSALHTRIVFYSVQRWTPALNAQFPHITADDNNHIGFLSIKSY